MPIEELDSLLVLLAERKQKVENEEAESHTETLLDFLMRSQLRKQEKMNEVSAPFLLFLLLFQCFNPDHSSLGSSYRIHGRSKFGVSHDT